MCAFFAFSLVFLLISPTPPPLYSLDRTNVSQVSVGAHVLGLQLRALGLLPPGHAPEPSGVFLRVLMEMYEAHGDAIAMQYGGSEANKKVTASSHEEGLRHGDAAEGGGGGSSSGGADKAGGGGGWGLSTFFSASAGSLASLNNNLRLSSGGPSEILTSLQRYFSNSFTDSIKQASINIFLGLYQPRRVAGLLRGASSSSGREAVELGAAAFAAAAAGGLTDPLAGFHVWEIDSDYMLQQPLPDSGRGVPAPPEVREICSDWWSAPLAAYEGGVVTAAVTAAPPPSLSALFPRHPPIRAEQRPPAQQQQQLHPTYLYFEALLGASSTAPQQVGVAVAASATAGPTVTAPAVSARPKHVDFVGGAPLATAPHHPESAAAQTVAATSRATGASRKAGASPPPPPFRRHTLQDPVFGDSLFADILPPLVATTTHPPSTPSRGSPAAATPSPPRKASPPSPPCQSRSGFCHYRYAAKRRRR